MSRRSHRPPPKRARRDAGFSLIESLVALAVFATAGVGLIVMQTQSVQTVRALETRTLAGLVAQNLLVEAATSSAPVPQGVREGQTEMAGRSWPWRVEIAPTLDENVNRIDVRVRAPQEDSGGVDMVAFIPAGGAP
jgi:general secretion pathway protein I